MQRPLFRGIALCAALSLTAPPFAWAQAPAPASTAAPANAVTAFNTEQLDAMLAPIALYPDQLLAQVLMASTYPFQVVEAARWLDQGNNKSLTGDALAKALQPMTWDPSVKSLVPFPQVLLTMNSKLDWMQQLGYAVANQQADVMDSVQRLRRQAQAAGSLKTTEQQKVITTQQTIVIEPANPQVVYVPTYNPTVVYGTWPYVSTPPVYIPPPPGYVVGSALVSGLAFAAGVAVVGSLWGWATPSWGGYGRGGYMNVNVNRYNNINVNRTAINNNVWRAPNNRVGGLPNRPPGGPVGHPARPGGLPANAVGRPNVQVPGNLVGHPRAGAAGSGPAGGNLQRPGGAGGSGPGNVARPGGAGTGPGGGNLQRPSGAGGGTVQRPANVQRPTQAPSRGAFAGMNQGAQASQFSSRGAQSRSFQAQRPAGGGQAQRAGGGGVHRGGGGGGGGRHR
ncbi:MAG: DUF3300 domain-containing protein [Acetobacteraceae bacterium]